MKYKGDVGLYLSGAPVPIPDCMIYITQPTVKQIIQFNETDFLMAVQLIGKTDYISEIRAGNSELANKTDFQILLILINEDKNVKSYIDVLFELIFPNYDIVFEKNSINFYLKDTEEKRMCGMVNMYTFESFQRTVRELFVAESGDVEEAFNPVNDAAREIAEKLKKARQKSSESDKNKNDDKVSLFGIYASILAIGLQMDINIFFNYTAFQIVDAFKRYWAKDKFEFFRKCKTTPMMDTSEMEEPEEWTRNFYKYDNS